MGFKEQTIEDIHNAGVEVGRKIGWEIGREEGKKEILKLLLTKGKMSDHQIAGITNLSVDYINNIRREGEQ